MDYGCSVPIASLERTSRYLGVSPAYLIGSGVADAVRSPSLRITVSACGPVGSVDYAYAVTRLRTRIVSQRLRDEHVKVATVLGIVSVVVESIIMCKRGVGQR